MSADGVGKGGGRGGYRRYMDRGHDEYSNSSKQSWGSYSNGGPTRTHVEQQNGGTSNGVNGAVVENGNANGHANGNVNGHANGHANSTVNGNGGAQAALVELETRMSSMQTDITESLRKAGEKENQKFNLIFSILSELQNRQAQLEVSMRELKQQLGVPQEQNSPTSQGNSQGQFSMMSNGQAMQQMSGQMNGVTAASNGTGMVGNNMMSGVMQTDGSQIFPMTQMVVINGNGGGMQYAMPQVMTPNSTMGVMPIQFMQQGTDMTGGSSYMANGMSQDGGGCMGNSNGSTENGNSWTNEERQAGDNEAGSAGEAAETSK